MYILDDLIITESQERAKAFKDSPLLTKLMLKGVNAQSIVIENKDGKNTVVKHDCQSCGKGIDLISTESVNFGKFYVMPGECNDCKEEQYKNHLVTEKKREWEAKQSRCFGRQNRIVKQNKEPVYWDSLNHFKKVESQQHVINQMVEIVEGRREKGMYIYGGTGMGKTFLCKFLNNELCKKLRNTCFIKAVDLVLGIRNSSLYLNKGESLPTVLRHLRSVEVLIIDDFGVQKDTDFVRENLFSILDYRYENRKTTIFTSNLDTVDITERDGRLGSRLMDAEWMEAFHIKGADFRQGSPIKCS